MLRFYQCLICHNLFVVIDDGKVVPNCCGQQMQELKANEVDATVEKHVPEIFVNCQRVEVMVGKLPHPMLNEHYIHFVVLETTRGFYLKYLKIIDGNPCANFTIQKDEKVVAAYAYCNLHGLWKKSYED